jgi:hypothetical protein
MKGINEPKRVAAIYLALIHHPVVNRKGDIITSAVTNLDLHDISRAARTYGAGAVFCVTPLADQQQLIRRLVDHWTDGYGAEYNPDRREALALLHVTATVEAAKARVAAWEKATPHTVATSARQHRGAIDCVELGRQISDGIPLLLLFGTAWGLAPDAITAADAILAPIEGTGAYNHLSVRSAVAIILDRLAGRLDGAPNGSYRHNKFNR